MAPDLKLQKRQIEAGKNGAKFDLFQWHKINLFLNRTRFSAKFETVNTMKK